jgi:hypothetical protein
MDRAYVFVVCGAAAHIETLHFSLEFLKLRTALPIYVVTDASRNEVQIAHDLVIDVQTPSIYTDHQAAIYLKTGVHRFLPTGKRYVYLDTDILAISTDIDAVFDQFTSPIIFAPDHCVVEDFSAYAVNCSCLERWQQDWQRYHTAFEALDQNKNLQLSSSQEQEKQALQDLFFALKTKPIQRIISALRYLITPRYFQLNQRFVFDKKRRVWQTNSGAILLHETPNKAIAKQAKLKYNSLLRTWKTGSGKPLWEAKCTHLQDALQQKFSCPTIPKRWQHWNGGLFIFEDQSKAFLDRWHEWSVALFDDPKFKTRDQGTLIATVWSLGLQDQATLHPKWNFLLDYHSQEIRFAAADGQFSLKNGPYFSPVFVHVYHHWNDQNWHLWRWLTEQKNPT